MKNVEKADRYHLGSLIEELKRGHFVIPDFQRDFEWEPWDVLDLVRSIFMDYYIGTLLLWKGSKENFKLLSCENIYSHKGKADPQHIVLDGQQRLTAIHYALFNPGVNFPRRKTPIAFFLRIDSLLDEEFDNAFFYSAITRYYQAILNDKQKQFALHLFPLGEMKEGTWGISDWIKGYRDYWQDKADNVVPVLLDEGDQVAQKSHANANTAVAVERAKFEKYVVGAHEFKEHIEELFNQYYISYIELDKDIDVSKVCEIFTQINSKGVRLDIFDLLNAILRPKEIYLKQMWQAVQPELAYIDDKKMKVYVLMVMSILEQSYCSPKYLYYLVPEAAKTIKKEDGTKEQIVLIQDSQIFIEKWQNSVKALRGAVKSLKNPRDFGAIKPEFVPYPSIIPAFAAIKSYADNSDFKNKLDIQAKIRKWYWASIFTNRYSSAVESTSTRDFQDLKKWFLDDDAEPEPISDFEGKYKSIDLLNEDRKGSAVYNAIFNLFVINEARDWTSFDLPEYDTLDDHHIVPFSQFKDEAGPAINSILNRTPLSAVTNRHVIGAKMPNSYLRELFDNNEEDKVYGVLASHLISKKAVEILLRDPFSKEDFFEFLEERKSTILQAIENKLIREVVQIPVAYRDLNDKIEQTELAIRKLFFEKLSATSSSPYHDFTPSHIKEKVDERVRKELKKKPGLEASHFEDFARLLTFFDLQEFFQMATGKSLWPIFEESFKNKEQLQMRFNQLAGLRNCIRHSREVTEVERMDGEAAIAWFRSSLKISK